MVHTLPVAQFLEKSDHLPIIDVRSPGEYAQGHLPGAVNIPLFSDEERARVGTRYKQVGKDSAFLLGLEIVGPKMAYFVKQSRKVAPNGEVLVHCWRGGMRSGSFGWLLNTSGLQVSLLEKGYKAYRQEVLQSFEKPLPLLMLGGKTGSGKTGILKELAAQGEQILDLEGLAQHKGSSFGALGQQPQPTTEQFENLLHYHCAHLNANQRIWVEDESLTIGTARIPMGFWKQMRSAPVAFIDVPKAERVKRLVEEYGQFSQQLLTEAVQRIQKRLGGLDYRTALEAVTRQDYALVADITLTYYDKAYLHGLSQREAQRVFQIPVTGQDPTQIARQLIAWADANRAPFAGYLEAESRH